MSALSSFPHDSDTYKLALGTQAGTTTRLAKIEWLHIGSGLSLKEISNQVNIELSAAAATKYIAFHDGFNREPPYDPTERETYLQSLSEALESDIRMNDAELAEMAEFVKNARFSPCTVNVRLGYMGSSNPVSDSQYRLAVSWNFRSEGATGGPYRVCQIEPRAPIKTVVKEEPCEPEMLIKRESSEEKRDL